MDERRSDPRASGLTATARRALLAEKARIVEEIRAYPRPIAGCDAVFNHLLARRRDIERTLAADAQRDQTLSGT